MEAKELRIGNWVNVPESAFGFYSYTYRISPAFIEVRTNGVYQTFEINDIKPIPLTPEILEKAGFERIGNKWKLKNISIGLGNSFISCLIGQTYIEPNLKHLHQLQNLYFALTGEELKIEL